MKRYLILFLTLLVTTNSYSLSLFETKYSCEDKKNYPGQIFSVITKSNEMSILGPGLLSPLELKECLSNTHESKYELKSMGCKNYDLQRLWSFNKINLTMTIPEKSPRKSYLLECKKIK